MWQEEFYKKKDRLETIFSRVLSRLTRVNKVRGMAMVHKVNLIIKCISDVCEYLEISPSQFYERAQQWPEMEKILWNDSKGDIAAFYKSWNNEYAGYNICCNAYNQLLYEENFNAVVHVCKHEGVYIDYGCGVAALTLGLFFEKLIKGRLILLDVENDTHQFIKWRIKKYGLDGKVDFYNVDSFDFGKEADALFCIDVLEHLPNSSEIFIQKVHPLIKKQGYLVLRAPWRGQLTHLDAAADDFYCNGGRKFLAKHYSKFYRLANYDVAAVYKKKS